MPLPINVETVVNLARGKNAIPAGAGTVLIGDRLRKLGEVSPSGRSKINFTQVLLIKKGDRVPSAFMGIPGIKVDRNGNASNSYTDAWCQSNWNQGSDWGSDTWGECWDNSVARADQSLVIINTETTGIKAFSTKEFTARELKVLASLNLVR